MKQFTCKGAVLMFIVALVSTVGGCNEQEQIDALTHQNERLMSQNKVYRDEIVELEKANLQLKENGDVRDASLAEKNEQLAGLKQKLENTPAKDKEGDWEIGKYSDKISLGSDVLFSAGRATLTAAGKRTLGQVVSAIKGQYAGLPVRVYGFTDSDPVRKSKKLWKDNLDLSANRAMAVTRYLIGRGVPKENIETIGMGAANFIAGNRTQAEKARNRRVEIVVVKANK